MRAYVKKWFVEVLIASVFLAGISYAAHEQYFPNGIKAGTLTIDSGSITDSSGAISFGTTSVQISLFPVLSKTADYTLTSSDLGKSVRFSHVDTAGTMTLPSVGADEDGVRVIFVKSGAARLIIEAADSDTIMDSGAAGTIYSDSDYATIVLEYVHALTKWVVISPVGIWTTT
jgi:hypothetical protein